MLEKKGERYTQREMSGGKVDKGLKDRKAEERKVDA